MITTTALATTTRDVQPLGRQITLEIVEIAERIAPMMRHMSKTAMPVEHTIAIMLKGYELGFNLTAAMDYLKMLPDGPTLEVAGMLAIIHRSRLIDVKISDIVDPQSSEKIGASCLMRRRDTGFEYITSFTKFDAERAGLNTKDSYKKYGGVMYTWRAVGQCAQVVAPDLLAGLHLLPELDPNAPTPPHIATTDNGDIIDADTGEVLVEAGSEDE